MSSTLSLADRRSAAHADALLAWSAERQLDARSLATRLEIVGTVTVAAIARALVALFGGLFDQGRTENWVRAGAERQAENLVDSLRSELWVEGTDVDATWRSFEARADTTGAAMAASLTGFATNEFAQQDPRDFTKTWHTQSDNPRPSHAALDGDTVASDETFANGCRWPGDPEAPAEETAGCRCTVELQLDAGASSNGDSVTP